jgi:hypothetical protein
VENFLQRGNYKTRETEHEKARGCISRGKRQGKGDKKVVDESQQLQGQNLME